MNDWHGACVDMSFSCECLEGRQFTFAVHGVELLESTTIGLWWHRH